MARPSNHKVKAVEGLRALMAWWVVLGHIAHSLDGGVPLLDRVLRANGLAVEVFIVISGYVIARLITLQQESYALYVTRRALRIFPLYLVVLVVSALLLPVVLATLQASPVTNSRILQRIALATTALEALPAHLAVHLPLAQGLIPAWQLPNAPFTIVGQAWSISLEWQFYLLAPLFVCAPRRIWVFCLLLLGLLWLGTRPGMSPAFIGQSGHGFVIGVLSYHLMQDGRLRDPRLWAMLVAALALGCATAGLKPLIAVAIWGLVLASVHGGGRRGQLAQALSHPVMVRLGTESYSVYLLHMIPLSLGMAGLTALGVGGWAYGLGLYAVTILATWGLSRLTYRWIEMPFIAFGRRMKPGQEDARVVVAR